MPCVLSAEAVAQALGAKATLDRFPRLAHGIDQHVLNRVVERMQGD